MLNVDRAKYLLEEHQVDLIKMTDHFHTQIQEKISMILKGQTKDTILDQKCKKIANVLNHHWEMIKLASSSYKEELMMMIGLMQTLNCYDDINQSMDMNEANISTDSNETASANSNINNPIIHPIQAPTYTVSDGTNVNPNNNSLNFGEGNLNKIKYENAQNENKSDSISNENLLALSHHATINDHDASDINIDSEGTVSENDDIDIPMQINKKKKKSKTKSMSRPKRLRKRNRETQNIDSSNSSEPTAKRRKINNKHIEKPRSRSFVDIITDGIMLYKKAKGHYDDPTVGIIHLDYSKFIERLHVEEVINCNSLIINIGKKGKRLNKYIYKSLKIMLNEYLWIGTKCKVFRICFDGFNLNQACFTDSKSTKICKKIKKMIRSKTFSNMEKFQLNPVILKQSDVMDLREKLIGTALVEWDLKSEGDGAWCIDLQCTKLTI